MRSGDEQWKGRGFHNHHHAREMGWRRGERLTTSLKEEKGGSLVNETWQQVLPVLISILVIVVVAVLRVYSKTLAAITVGMPTTIPLALWIIYSGSGGDQTTVVHFIEVLFITLVANVFFIVAMWLAARAGWRLVPLLVAGYLAWGVALGLIVGVRHLLGR
jgi:hypothetical protein